MKLDALGKFADSLGNTRKMPVLFIGHGSPMNAIEENEFVRGFRRLGTELERPKAILCISAHWETDGARVTAMAQPRTIHDFGGFPEALYQVQYPAPGDPVLAGQVQALARPDDVMLDHEWGLDHGAWTVIKHLYPDADVPVIQLSLDRKRSLRQHVELARELATLRSKGVLIIGSGNMVHNLRLVAWDKLQGAPYAYDWATEANERMKQLVMNGDLPGLVGLRSEGRAFELAIPTYEHYLPLLYASAIRDNNEAITTFNDQYVAGSLSMTSFKFG